MRICLLMISGFLLMGCAHLQPMPALACTCTGGEYPEDVALVNHWTEELARGDISVNDYKFLIRGRLEIMR